MHLRADRRSIHKTSKVLSEWNVDPEEVRVIEWPGGSTEQVAAAIAPVVQRLSQFRWTQNSGARWFPLRPQGQYIVEIGDGPDSSRFARHMQDVALVVVGYVSLQLIGDLLRD